MNVWIWIAIAFAVSGVLFYIFVMFYIAHCVYVRTLKRLTKDTWSRNPVFETELQKRMDEIGQEWHKENLVHGNEVHIVNREGMNLYGEFYDFGSDKTAMILSGRTESLRYGYFFAKPYADFGMNVLIFDPRAHGLSDGEFNTVGFEESKDILDWVDFLVKEKKQQSIIFHGICIGAAGGMFALTSGKCPDAVKGIVTEGMFPNFGESTKNHMIEQKRPNFPVFQLVDFWMKHYTGHSMMFGPINVIHKMERPLLMIHSKADIYSTPEYAKKLYALCPSENKQIVWYEKGGHSMLRITDTEKYDTSITAFLESVFSE